MKPIIVNLNFIGDQGQDPKKVAELLQEVQQGLNPGASAQAPSYSNVASAPWLSHLNSEQLHFLSVFVHCEGKIKDVEKALGVSYPTVKAKLAGLKNAMTTDPGPGPQPSESPRTDNASALGILDQLNQGTIDVNQAIQQLKNTQRGK